MARPAPERQASNTHTDPGSWSPTRDALRPAERPLVAPNRPPSRPSASSGRPTTIRPKAVRRRGHPLTLIARGRSSCGTAVRPGRLARAVRRCCGRSESAPLSVKLQAKRARRGQPQSRSGRFGRAPRIEVVADDASLTPFAGSAGSGSLPGGGGSFRRLIGQSRRRRSAAAHDPDRPAQRRPPDLRGRSFRPLARASASPFGARAAETVCGRSAASSPQARRLPR
jgi:hypothetical protein